MWNRALVLLPTSLILTVPANLCAKTASESASNMTPKTQSPTAIHRSAIVIDTHADTPQRFVDENFDLADPLGNGNFNLESVRKGNLGAEFFSIWVDPVPNKGQYARRTLILIDALKQQGANLPDRVMFVATPEGLDL